MKNQLRDAQITGETLPELGKVLTPEVQEFLVKLHRKFNPRRLELLKQRAIYQKN